MATSLVCEFMKSDGSKQSITWANVDPEVPASEVKTFVNGVVTASATLLKDTLTSAVSATLRTTTDTPVSLD